MVAEKKMPKLLAPIRSFEGAVKVIQAGADELYCGVVSEIPAIKDFMLFRGADENMPTYDELGRVVKYAHNHGVQVAITANLPFMVETIEEETRRHIRLCLDEGVDAFLVGDFGVLSIIKRMSGKTPLYASTYLASTNYEAVNFLKELGFSRVVLERQLTLREISEIVRCSEVEVEVFIHGAGCPNINANCYLHGASRALTRARFETDTPFNPPCMLPFDIHDANSMQKIEERAPIMDAYTFCSICRLPELIQAGVTNFKIVGRGLCIDYQESTTKIYRELIDLIEHGQMKSFAEKVESLRRNFIILPPGLATLQEGCCEQKRCYYSTLFHAPYRLPQSWHAWTKNRFKYALVVDGERQFLGADR